MSRKSMRELERWIEERERAPEEKDVSIDAREGVTAPWITYNRGGFDEEDLIDDPRTEVLVLTAEEGFVSREEFDRRDDLDRSLGPERAYEEHKRSQENADE